MTVLVREQGLRHRRGGVGHPVVGFVAFPQFVVNLLDDIDHRRGLAHLFRVPERVLQGFHVAQHFGIFKRLGGHSLFAEKQGDLVPRLRGGRILFRGLGDARLDFFQQGEQGPVLQLPLFGNGLFEDQEGLLAGPAHSRDEGFEFARPPFEVGTKFFHFFVKKGFVGFPVQDQVGHVGAAEVLVEDPVGHPDGMVFFEPLDGIVVHLDLRDPHDRQDQDHAGDPQDGVDVPEGALAGGAEPSLEEGRRPGGILRPAEGGQRRFGKEHDISRDESDGQHPRQQDPESHEQPENPDRGNGRQGQRGESRRRRQAGEQHGSEQLGHHGLHRLHPVPEILVAVEKLAQDVDGIDHRDGHEEDGDHRAHDVHGEPQADEESHRAHHGRPRDDQGGKDQHRLAEEKPHQQKEEQSRQRRRNRHLPEHLDAERVLRHGQAGDVVLFVAFQLADPGADFFRDDVAQVLGPDGDVEAEGFAVLRQKGAVQERIVPGAVADVERLLPRFRRFRHQPLEPHRAQARLLDVVHFRRGQEVDRDDAVDAFDLLRQGMDRFQRAGIEHAVGMGFVHHAQDDHVVQGEHPLDPVVKDADEFFPGQHIFRVGVDLDAGDLQAEPQADQKDQQAELFGMLDAPPSPLLWKFHDEPSPLDRKGPCERGRDRGSNRAIRTRYTVWPAN